ncbi:MAG: glycosyltransferase [Synechococcales cyanobacterium C42_A2020_086]|jgi:glycosyltransferase involved in cell wall biosynthesis|nr:glycosyltransferase [Synechococcales cyanobacterium C42_A2020_086]
MTSSSVSVVIPTYNCARYLGEAIDSVLQQTHPAAELIVVDDGSTDETADVLQRYGERLQVIRQTNQGVAVARNQGIRQARGEWIAFLDADDYFLPDKLAAQMAIAAQHPRAGIVHSGWQRITATGEPLITVKLWQQVPQLNLEGWLRWKPVLPSAMLFRRAWLEQAGGFDPRFPPAEDTELVLRLARMGCEAVWLPQVTVCYRQHGESAMHQGLPQARSLMAVIDHFFTTQCPESIRWLEPRIRYHTLVWIAWYLQSTGHMTEMVQHLQQSWQYSPYAPLETLVHWVESFASFAQGWGYSFDAESLAGSAEWQYLTRWLNQQIARSVSTVA